MAMRISKDRVDLDDKELQRPVLKDYGEAVVTSDSGSNYTIDLEQGNVFDITLTDNCAFTFANPPASGTAGSITLFLTQDATGGRTVTWPSAVKWLGGTEPTLETNPDSVNVLTFLTIDGGTTWYGTDNQGVDAAAYPLYLDYGYFGGGDNGPTVSRIDRIDYSSDTATASLRGPLSQARYQLAATGTSSYGYFGGGDAGPSNVSRVDRIDYANDTVTAVQRGPLSQARRQLAATGTSSYGYFGGGFPGPVSTVDRIDYANDTVTASVRGPLSQARDWLAATGTSSYGYFGGGYAPGLVSRADRIDYANDTVAASLRGPLSQARYYLAATGSSSYGYFGGGNLGSPSFDEVSRVDRIDYSSDTVTAVARGPLSQARYGPAATGSSSYGYFGGGGPGPVSVVDRIDYANDTVTAVQRGPLSAARYSPGGLQNCPL